MISMRNEKYATRRSYGLVTIIINKLYWVNYNLHCVHTSTTMDIGYKKSMSVNVDLNQNTLCCKM